MLPATLSMVVWNCKAEDVDYFSAAQAGLWQSVLEAVARGQDCSIVVARELLRKLLIPGEHSPKALSLALEELGKPVSASNLKGNSVEQILDFLIEVSPSPCSDAASLGHLGIQAVALREQSWCNPVYLARYKRVQCQLRCQQFFACLSRCRGCSCRCR